MLLIYVMYHIDCEIVGLFEICGGIDRDLTLITFLEIFV